MSAIIIIHALKQQSLFSESILQNYSSGHKNSCANIFTAASTIRFLLPQSPPDWATTSHLQNYGSLMHLVHLLSLLPFLPPQSTTPISGTELLTDHATLLLKSFDGFLCKFLIKSLRTTPIASLILFSPLVMHLQQGQPSLTEENMFAPALELWH